ncbi:serine/threonine protein kinase [Thermogymnomonas acidicola]|uniref:tRNA N6-adenosine threonylcarbamoyltransferase n=1 Tax=Thermogymnomonas acidicola TaxID=399579 RepID=A0AA37BPQ5_9ARCH|nr:serine/threonine protein kinase [Thermogymnomonas acidicola]
MLGIEGTAHTVSAGIVDGERVLSNVSSTYRPERGGIHPREASIHHFENVTRVVKEALSAASLTMNDIDLVAFSQGPGLGPCLRVVSTAARALALKYRLPLLGVNHPLGHIEIGRKLSGASDPVMLYVSGGNTQVIAHRYGRYRVFGETMDIGVGNLLDKVARDMGIPFPGGPEIERLARDGRKLLHLPYSVKGMDTSFSGMYTATLRHIRKGERREDIAFSIQETAFSMLVEVLERALYVLDKEEILLAGGVALNSRLREMVSSMARDAGVRAYMTDPKYCMDNGAMIAQAGLLMFTSGIRQRLEETGIQQRQRIDSVPAPWVAEVQGSGFSMVGAESRIEVLRFFSREAITKRRLPKGYREAGLDTALRRERTRNEASILLRLMENGLPVPVLYDVDMEALSLTMERLHAVTLREYLMAHEGSAVMEALGSLVARMHSLGVSHGDLTTNNVLVGAEGQVWLIDPSMGSLAAGAEDTATDVFLLYECLRSQHPEHQSLFSMFMEGYRKAGGDAQGVMRKIEEIEGRRRYV